MLRSIYMKWLQLEHCRTRRVLRRIRRQLETSGYTVNGIPDSVLEAAVAFDGRRIEDVLPLTAKKTYWILRRISPDVTKLRWRRDRDRSEA
ncbi:MAG: hypothetical protein IPM25_08945 [Chloracidobacterium sp.]|nr:hypothetical protein [Chloracidobacterium sp.]